MKYLSHPAHISLLLNTDGVALYRSSKVSIWDDPNSGSVYTRCYMWALQVSSSTHIVAWYFLLQRQTSHEHVSQASDRRSQHNIHRRSYTA